MRRRREDQPLDVPAHLWTFQAEDWTGDALERWHAWHRARRDHFEAAPDAWPDAVTLLVDSWQVRRRLLEVARGS